MLTAIRLLSRLAAVAALGLASPAGAQEPPAPAAAPEPVVVSLGTASITGVYFPVGVSLCRLVNQHRRDTGVRCAARPGAGSVDNIAGLRDGTLGLAIVQSDVQAQALAGAGPFASAGAFTDLRSVMGLYPEPLTLVTRDDSGIERVEDLAGKRVWLGPEGSGTRLLADTLLGALGWTEESVEAAPAEIGADGVAQALCDGEIDAFLYAVGHPALIVQDAALACGARLAPIDGPAIEALVAARPDLSMATIPSGLYPGSSEAVETFGVSATVVTRADAPEDRVNAMVAQIFADIDLLRGLEPVLTDADPEAMVGLGRSAPLHPGAERYYRDRGWLD